MTIRGRQFNRITGRTVDRRPDHRARNREQLSALQSTYRPIYERPSRKKRGNPASQTSSTHQMWVTEQAPGVYGYIRS